MAKEDEQRWDERYRNGRGPRATQARTRLELCVDHIDALERRVRSEGIEPTALDIGCGSGGAQIWLAQRGWSALGVDASGEALKLATAAAAEAGLAERCTFVHADLDLWRPAVNSAHLLTCFYFLDRRLWPAMEAAVRPGGLILMETFNRHCLVDQPMRKMDYLLAPGEWVQLVQEWGWLALAHGSQDSHGVDGRQAIDWIFAKKGMVENEGEP